MWICEELWWGSHSLQKYQLQNYYLQKSIFVKKVAVFWSVNFAVNVNGIALFHGENGSAMQNLGLRFGLGKRLAIVFGGRLPGLG